MRAQMHIPWCVGARVVRVRNIENNGTFTQTSRWAVHNDILGHSKFRRIIKEIDKAAHGERFYVIDVCSEALNMWSLGV